MSDTHQEPVKSGDVWVFFLNGKPLFRRSYQRLRTENEVDWCWARLEGELGKTERRLKDEGWQLRLVKWEVV